MIEYTDKELIKAYKELKSTYKVASKFNATRHSVKKRLKELGVLRTQSQAAKERTTSNFSYKRTDEHKQKLRELAKARKGDKNPFFGKKHTKEARKKMSEAAKERTGRRNPNYKHGENFRRPRDFKTHELKPVRNLAYNRDNHTCYYCNKRGGHLHAHHILPYWFCKDAFLDIDNLITVCTNCHFTKAHTNNWAKFDITLISEELIVKYHICRERLNELASLWKMR